MGWYISGLIGNVVTSNESIPEQNFEVKVFPNPVEDYLNVAFPLQSQIRDIKIELINPQGQILQSIENQSVMVGNYAIDVRFLPEGMYFLKVVDGVKIKTFKVVK